MNYKVLYAIIIGTILFSIECNAQQGQTSNDDSTVIAIKIRNLKNRKAALQKQIVEEDKKRNVVIEGVSPEALEIKNERQDSICLELRSELTTIELELSELAPNKTAAQIAQQYNHLLQNNQQDSTRHATTNKPTVPASSSKPNDPVKPVKEK